MKKKQISYGGYVVTGDLSTDTVQINVISLPPKRGRIKREIFASIVDAVVAVMSQFFCSCCDKESSITPLLGSVESETLNIKVETA